MTERPPLDDIDLKILSELQKDGRIRIQRTGQPRRHLGSLPACGAYGPCAAAAIINGDPRHARRKAARL